MTNFLRKTLPLLAFAAFSTPAISSDTVDAAIGGAVGGAAGAVIGSELGGRDGAIAGAAVGAAVGTAVATSDGDNGSSTRIHTDSHYKKKGGPPAHAYHAPPGHVKHGKAKGKW